MTNQRTLQQIQLIAKINDKQQLRKIAHAAKRVVMAYENCVAMDQKPMYVALHNLAVRDLQTILKGYI